MTWWKKILSVIPLFIAGYEVGKTTDTNDNMELVEVLRNNVQLKNEQNIVKPEQMSYMEIISILTIIIIAIIYLTKIICKAIKSNNSNNNNIQLQQI